MGAYTRGRENIDESFEFIFSLFPILYNRLNQKAGTLSGGEQQMLALGRGLMAKPKLLLLDEPSLGLAPVIVELIYDTITKIHKQGMTVLLIEQNAYIALEVADRGYVIETGVIRISGSANDLLNNEAVRDAYLGN